MKSGKRENSFYIDYAGSYTLEDIAKIVSLETALINTIYTQFDAVHDPALDVYYFSSSENAHECIEQLFMHIHKDIICKALYFTDAEIQYIRQALINEGVNTIKLKNTIKDDIFKKLNNA